MWEIIQRFLQPFAVRLSSCADEAVRSVRRQRFWLILLAFSLPCPLVTHAQGSSDFALTVAAGPGPYDLSGTGTGLAVAARLDWVALSPMIVEPGVTYFRYGSESYRNHVFPELSVQIAPRIGAVRPYLGAGAGVSFVLSGDWTDLTLHVTTGVRLDIAGHWGLRGEGRLRSVDPWAGNTVDITGGVTFRF
jgi:hypothetical protein